jgi:hypothetical protein
VEVYIEEERRGERETSRGYGEAGKEGAETTPKPEAPGQFGTLGGPGRRLSGRQPDSRYVS